MKKIFYVLSLGLLVYLIYVLVSTPLAVGYEVNIYSAYPLWFWVCFGMCYFINLTQLIRGIFYKARIVTPVIFLGLLNILLLLLPLFRGYLTIDFGDSSSHIGYIKDILSSGFAWSAIVNDPYPVSHVISAIMQVSTGASVEAVAQITGVFYYVAFVAFTYLLLRELYTDKSRALMILPFLFIPIYKNYTYYPSLFFFELIPMLGYFLIKYIKTSKKLWSILASITMALLPVFHPASFVLLGLVVVILFTVLYFTNRDLFLLAVGRCYPILLLGVFVWCLRLYTLFGFTSGWLNTYAQWLHDPGSNPSEYGTYMAGLNDAKLSFLSAVWLYLKMLGSLHILIGLSLGAVALQFYQWSKHGKNMVDLVFVYLLLAFVVMQVVSFFYTLPLLGDRLYTYTTFLAMVVLSGFVYQLEIGIKK